MSLGFELFRSPQVLMLAAGIILALIAVWLLFKPRPSFFSGPAQPEASTPTKRTAPRSEMVFCIIFVVVGAE